MTEAEIRAAAAELPIEHGGIVRLPRSWMHRFCTPGAWADLLLEIALRLAGKDASDLGSRLLVERSFYEDVWLVSVRAKA